jgi:hypothetical protein
MSDNSEHPHGLRELVYARLPEGASPVDTACHPLHRRIIERAGGDVIEETTRKLGAALGGRAHIVLEIRDGDLDPARDHELMGLLTQTDGGVLVFGVAYETADESSVP